VGHPPKDSWQRSKYYAPRQAEWTPHGEVQGAELFSVPILAKLYLASPHVYLMADGLQVWMPHPS
jgi:hypothetical protein